MHPNNWAMAQGHMLGTEPHSFFPSPLTGTFYLLLWKEQEGHQHVNVISLCPLQLRAASLRHRSSAMTVPCPAGRSSLVCRFELMTTLPVCLAPLWCQAALSAFVPRTWPSLRLDIPFSFSEDIPQIAFLASVSFLYSLFQVSCSGS